MIQYYSHFGADPYFNMAFDEWMFAKALSEAGSCYLRLYTWSRPAITFGFHQHYERAFDHTKLGEIPAIRRVTGGRALLHDPSELTYSIAINTGYDGVNVRTGSELSTGIARTLVDFLRRVGIDCAFVRASAPQNSSSEFFQKAPCFASMARYEIVRGEQKIVASAQRRLEAVVFQHGSIKVSGAVSHPAVELKSSGGELFENPPPITGILFRHMEQRFIEAFRKWVDEPVVARELSESDLAGLSEGEKLVRKNRLLRRDIFKQK